MPAKKYLTLAAAAFVAFYVVTQPDGATRSVETVAGGLAGAAGSVITFINAVG
ncbi:MULTISPECIES: hypothetical protein [Actinomadura]|uniref:hypothetical protein n=1 Tax=Actinomadura TaxID=1988 RepID=UPI0003F50A94|nr:MULTISPECIES: hypothetical protein [Actinomadura]